MGSGEEDSIDRQDQPTMDFLRPVAPAAITMRYEILSEAGRGGMGIVYKARDRETGELVALKVLKPEIAADQAAMERFKNELRLARKITHRNVCRTHDFYRAADGTAYISMEFVEGDSLRAIVTRFGGLACRRATEIAGQICAALTEAHRQGVVHRDLKPENIMLDRDGAIKVMDFGVARCMEASATLAGQITGTPAYMAPEQAAGKPDVDHRADIYSLGLVLYEIYTGAPAVRGETPVAVVMKQIHDTPASPREVEPALPAHIEKAILRCLEKNPGKRFQTVDELGAALRQELEAEPTTPATEGEGVPLPPHLTRWQRSDYGLFFLALFAGASFFYLFDTTYPYSALEARLAKIAASDKARAPQLKLDQLTADEYGRDVLVLGLSEANRQLRQESVWSVEAPRVPTARKRKKEELNSAAWDSARQSFDWYKKVTHVQGLVILCSLGLFMCILFFARRLAFVLLSRSVRFTAYLVISALAVSAVFYVRGSASTEGLHVLLQQVFFLLLALFFGLLSVLPVRVSEYYSVRAFPQRLHSWQKLVGHCLEARPAGLALLRGCALGAAYLGAHTALMAVLGAGRIGGPSLDEVTGQSVPLVWGSVGDAVVTAILASWCLLTFPAALASRIRSQPYLLVGLPTAFWLIAGVSLPGASAFPLLPSFLIVLLQGVYLSCALHLYDFLTIVATIFTIETWLLTYPAYRIFRQIEFLQSLLALLPWALLLLLGVTICLRPQLTRSWRRAAAVFQ